MRKILKIVIAALAIFCYTGVVSGETRYTNANEGLRLRENYSTDSAVLDTLPYGTAVDAVGWVLDGFDYWIRVEYNDKVGYVMGKYLSKSELGDPHDGMSYLGNWHCTAYTHTGNVCANGNYPSAGYTIACNGLPFGVQVYIDGIGYRTVEDRGPASLGNEWLDLFHDSYDECVAFGSQYHDVWIVN